MNLFDIQPQGTGPEKYKTPEVVPIDPNDELAVQEVEPEGVGGGMTLRPYQVEAVEGIYREWTKHQSTLLVLPTGTGKTVCLAEVIRRRPVGRVMFIAHRDELIFQGKRTIEAHTGCIADIEMADQYAGGSDVVIATVQTLSRGRVEAFPSGQFSLLIIDEAHHATADTYVKIHDWFKSNASIKILGVTATPDRADEEALGQVFETVAFDYELPEAIKDGWLVPIAVRAVYVEGLDYSTIRTTAGDLNGADLAAVMEAEETLHKVAAPTLELVAGRKALVFAASVTHAERLCEIFNRHNDGCARWVCGKTDKDVRREMFADYKNNQFSILVNVGVATEGFDEPTIEVIVLARPTKSRSLYAQMVGRGTRALPGVVDGPATPELRRAAIAASGKRGLEVIDFVGNVGKHQLVSVADILGGSYSDEEIAEAEAATKAAAGAPVDQTEALEDARRRIEEQKAKEAARRAKVRVGAIYTTSGPLDPFKLLGVNKYRERGWEKGKAISEKQKAWITKQGMWKDDMTFSEARQICQGLSKRIDAGLCSVKQAGLLAKHGFPASTTFADARKIIDVLAKNRWQWPANVPKPGVAAEVETPF